MNKDPAGNPAPPEGFQTGGWYSGYQYWNGTFASQAGVIHPASNQQGAGETVSEEVNAQGDIAQGQAPGTNQAYINQQNQQVQPQAQTPSTPASSSMSTPGTESSISGSAQLDTPDLTGIYKGLLESSGVTALQDEYLEKEKQFIEAKAENNDNPWLSEATRVGREDKLTELFNERTANLQDEIAMKKADNEMMLNLQMQQYQIDSEANQQNISNLSNLINMGAFDNASGETIAAWTRATGLSSDIITSAIEASKKEDVETDIRYSVADSGEETVSVINSKTGDVISQKSLGLVGNKQGGSGGGGNDQPSATEVKAAAKQAALSGKTWTDMKSFFGQYLNPDEILAIYNDANFYGRPPDELNE